MICISANSFTQNKYASQTTQFHAPGTVLKNGNLIRVNFSHTCADSNFRNFLIYYSRPQKFSFEQF